MYAFHSNRDRIYTGALRTNNMFCVCTEVLWGKIIQLLENKVTPHFQLSPMSAVDQF